MDNEFELNQEQQRAIDYYKGPLLIIAGAGTGKTHVIVEKIKSLILKKIAKPENILALTFTQKAASEMEERVDKEIPYGYFQMWISTFHSLADQILKEEAAHIGLPSDFRLITKAESIVFLRKNMFRLELKYFRPLGNPNKFLEAMLQHFSRLKDEDIDSAEYLAWANNKRSARQYSKDERQKNIELANAYKTYQLLKTKEGFLDFSDLVFYLIRLFKKREAILKKYRDQFRYILVDEFQDTNIAQYNLIKLLSPSRANPALTVVGDDSQAIYKFRGASVSNILTFMKDYPKAKQITLRKNYRSNQEILDAAYRLIKHNDPDTLEATLGISKNLIATKPTTDNRPASPAGGQPISFSISDKVENEAGLVAQQIIALTKKYSFSDMAILVRAHNHSDSFVRVLARKGIPYQFLGPGMLFKLPEIKDLIAYLKVLYDLEDSVSLYRVLTMDIFEYDSRDLNFLLSFSRRVNLSLFQTIELYLSFSYRQLYREEFENYKKYLPLLSIKTKERLYELYKIIKKHLSLVHKETAGQILYYFFENTKYLNRLISYKTEKEEKIALNISKFFSKLKEFETNHEDASVKACVDYITVSMELGESPFEVETDISAINAVNILTVHAAKGLEFPVVFLVNLTQGRFPSYEKRESIPLPQDLIKEILPKGDYHIQEERRLFYVGLTRARDKAYFSASEFYGEGKRKQKISPFVFESLGEEAVQRHYTQKKDEKRQLSIFDFKKVYAPEYNIKDNKNAERFAPQLTSISYSQLETYATCPLQYKYRHVLRIPEAPVAALSFGDSIHKTLHEFYREYMTNKTIGESRLLEIYSRQWIPLGYGSGSHEKKMKQEGVKMLKKFFKTYHTKNIKIIDLEKTFRIKIDANILLRGKIDRADSIDQNRLEIIDYKTGKKMSELRLKKSLQLSTYALAASDRGVFGRKLDEITLTFYFLQDMEKYTTHKTEDDLIKTKDYIIQTVGDIKKSDFPPNVGPWCDFCPFRMICEAWQ